MSGKRILKVVFVLMIIAGLVLGGVAIYNAGFAHGAMTNLPLPEGSEVPFGTFGHAPYAYRLAPRVGLLGLFPVLCFGGFFFLLLFFGFGFCARRRAWMRFGQGDHHHWKHYDPPPWEPERPETESQAPPDDVDNSQA